jgi:peptidoglycan L-alanyl-D-glutamate endopeptidase CwlK
MPLGRESKLRLATCDPRLQQLVSAVAADVDAGLVPGVSDISVACGYRGQAEQDAAFERGASTLRWPKSEHNTKPSRAVDVWPYPVDWTGKGLPAFIALRRAFTAKAKLLGIRIRHISWDWPHHELLD